MLRAFEIFLAFATLGSIISIKQIIEKCGYWTILLIPVVAVAAALSYKEIYKTAHDYVVVWIYGQDSLLTNPGCPQGQRLDDGRCAASDPREELAQHGILWNADYFGQALRQKDAWAVERFLRGGMKMSTGLNSQYAAYVYWNYFDQKIADLIVHYKAVDPAGACPVPPNGQYYSYKFYTQTAIASLQKAKFVREICDIPTVLARFDQQLAALSASAEQRQKSADLIARNQADPVGRQAGNEIQAEMHRELGDVLFEDPRTQLFGWRAARQFLVGG